MTSPDLVGRVCACLLLSLRVAPVFAMAPPFSLVRTPVIFRVAFGLAITACLVAADPHLTQVGDLSPGYLIVAAARELMLGIVFVMAFHLMFGMLYLAGRTLDIQAGFGMSMLVDPTSQAQTPLVGTLFAYAAAAVFFAMGGHYDLLRLMEASLHAMPLGEGYLQPDSLARVAMFMGILSSTGFGIAGGAMLILFLADMAITLLSRTVPQMNVLVLGFQVKTILLLLVLPMTLGASGALLARMTTLTLEALPGLL
ncbi:MULTISPECIES: flagellar biosynthetic protein FliR [Asticcacaulis]|uniref:flagellar biosynthetic protein FliR n=1 Tax=Asticcacaulis TaxID=76890 RepID=UPI001AE50C3C|nr:MULTISPECIES: flagellar biosynthetic protein FliR [Asticcacaulis]MBP2161160.1 flagellar biosynthetic protein FliR [Asticcacaulis solisilvae]MDR6802205.1 flagellar biosynthetic protein FliR [Asticcacaulis sp. BE141]